MWYHDIAALIVAEGGGIAWQDLFTRAQAADLILPLRYTLLRLADEWHVPMPADVLTRLRELRPPADEARIFQRLTASERPVAQRFYTDLAAMAGWPRTA